MNARLKTIVIISDFAFVNGGGAKVAIDSARLLADAGYKVIFFASCGPVDDSLHRPEIDVVCLNQKDILNENNRAKAAIQGIWNKKAATALSTLLSKCDPSTTIVHTHSYTKALSASIGAVICKSDFANVFTMHDYFLACPNGGFYDYRAGEICTRRAMGVSCLTTNCDVRNGAHKVWRVTRQMVSASVGQLPRGLQDIIYISETQRKVLSPYLPKQAHLHYVPNPISQPKSKPINADENEIFLFIGRLNPEKGGKLFAQAAKDARVKAVFVGEGVEQSAIQEINPHAEITGWISTAEVQKWVEKARCLVFPSLWYECQPLVPQEVLAHGVPVICGKWTAAAESVEDGKTGVHVSLPKASQFQHAIMALKNDNPIFSTTHMAAQNRPDTEKRHLLGLEDVYFKSLSRRVRSG